MPIVEAPKQPEVMECWFEFNMSLRDEVSRGYPERIFCSDDPAWEKFAADHKYRTKKGRLKFGTNRREAGSMEFFPSSEKIAHSFYMGWEPAREMMRKFEKTGVVVETPIADAQKVEEEKIAKGQQSVADAIGSALRDFAAATASNKAVTK